MTDYPWGSCEVLEEQEKYSVKKIIISPKKRFSLHYHLLQSEHWVIISGQGKMVLGANQDFIVFERDAFFIPENTIHRLENVVDVPLILVQTSMGPSLNESDVYRLADDYHCEKKGKMVQCMKL